METNTDSMRWHPAKGRRAAARVRRIGGEAEVVDLAAERALRLLALAGMIEAPAVPPRGRTVR